MYRCYKPTGAVETRYRDVSFEDVEGCFTPADEEDRLRWEQECRGKPITIWAPPIPNDFIDNGFVYQNGNTLYHVGAAPLCPSGCQGPFYGIRGFEGCVCQHLIEIGD